MNTPQKAPDSFDPLGRLPGEPHTAYMHFRQWERECQTMTQSEAARTLLVKQGYLSATMRAYHWRARADAAHLGASFQYPEGTHQADRAVAELPPNLAAEVRRREWSVALELVAAGAEALRRWRESKKAPGLSDVVKLFELWSRLARLAAGMGGEAAPVAAVLNNQVKIELDLALKKAYGQPEEIPVTAEVRHAE